MDSDLFSLIQQLNQESVQATAWILWRGEHQGGFSIASAWGFGDQKLHELHAQWQGNEQLLNQVSSRGQMALATGRMTPLSGAGRPVSIVAYPLPGGEIPGVLQFFFSEARLAEQLMQQGGAGAAWDQLRATWREVAENFGESTGSSGEEAECKLPTWLRKVEAVRRELPLSEQTTALLNLYCLEYDVDRCSLLRYRSGRGELLGVSGVNEPEPRSEQVRLLLERARELWDRHGEERSDEQRGRIPKLLPCERDEGKQFCYSSAYLAGKVNGDRVSSGWQLLLERRKGPLTAGSRQRIEAEQGLWLLAFQAIQEEATQRPRKRHRIGRTSVALAVVVGVLLLPIPLVISAPGHFVPEHRRNIFAPEDGHIAVADLHLPEDGRVHVGQLLLTITSRALELELSQTEGQLATVNEQIRSLRSTRSERETSPGERLTVDRDVSIKLAELQARQGGLEQERSLLLSRRESLRVQSPLDGEILTWNPQLQLAGRPVSRGQQLLMIGQTEGSWEVIAEVRDRDLAYFLQGVERRSGQVRLRAEFSEQGHGSGRVREVSPSFQELRPGEYTARVRIETANWTPLPRPGSRVQVLVQAGIYPAGYVWFRGAIQTLRRLATW